MPQAQELENKIASGNVAFFIEEFSFSRSEFTPLGKSELELADHLVVFDDVVLAYQMKERSAATSDPAAEAAWFEKKVLKKATSQIRDTVALLGEQDIAIRNERGHQVLLKKADPRRRLFKIVVFAPGEALGLELRYTKAHVSKTAGFIHLIPAPEYLAMLNTLVTIPEIIEYLEFRQEVVEAHPEKANTLFEKAILGQYLAGTVGEPTPKFARYVDELVADTDTFNILGILHRFGPKTVDSRADGASLGYPENYYGVLLELLRLTRADLVQFKQRFLLSWEGCGGEYVVPYLFGSGTTGCGFVFIPVATDHTAHYQTALNNLTRGAKHVLQVDRCIGITFRRDGSERLLDWMFLSYPWESDPEIESWLAKGSPFRTLTMRGTARYEFTSDGKK